MNATEITSGGLISTTSFWEVAIPLVVASIIVPVAFSGLFIRMTIKVVRSLYRKWLKWRSLVIAGTFMALAVASAIMGGRPLFWVVWALNLLYTLEYLIWIPAIYRTLLLVSRRLKEAKAARKSYTSTYASTAPESNSATDFDMVRISNASRDSDGTESSWVTAHPGVSEGSSETEGSWVTADPGSSTVNSTDLYLDVTRERLRKTHWQRRIEASAVYAHAAFTLGALGLGAAFLTMDIMYPKVRGLSLYHSFALWMSLVPAVETIGLSGLSYIFKGVTYYLERRLVREFVAERRRRGSDTSHSARGVNITSDGAV